MKVAIVIHDLRGGGAEKMMMRLANAISKHQHHVDLVLLTDGGVNKSSLSTGVNLIELKSSRTASAVPRLREYLKSNQPDQVLSALTHVNVIAFFACLSLGWLSRLHCSERNAFSFDKHVNNSPLIKFAYFLAPFIYRSMPNPVIAVSKGVGLDLIETTVVAEKNVINLPNPTLDDDFRLREFSMPTHPWLLEKTKPVIVGLGRLAPQKGFSDLISAFAILKQTIDARLVIFGEGDLRMSLQLQIDELNLTEDVCLHGYVSSPMDEIHHADLFVLSSLFEGSPNALVEAMASRCKVVSTRCPCGPDEILAEGAVGKLVPVSSPRELADAMSDSLSNTQYDFDNQLDHIERYTANNSAISYLNAMVNKRA
ncbi:glycosyltransferase [Motilimonas cestriensis]|uniref:Glycosyltransferase n=1 Tax=Motilimonas cestriensis TaxID=2742685 RepID=A0ABS8W6V9_9GAMM|nr:glycosyltransferase [Motilimonas cestriensis]MCE2594719.1 glycosyltransferase [Motilimonas cestriensis]